MKKLKKMLSTPFSMLPIVAILLVFTSGVSTYFTFLENEKNSIITERMQLQHRYNEWRSIEETIQFNMDLHRQNSRIHAIAIEKDLRAHYENLDDLERQVDSNTYDDDFYRILENNLYDADMKDRTHQRPFLRMAGTSSHLIAFYSNNKANTVYPIIKDPKDPSWSGISGLNPYNEGLSREAYKAIVNQSTGLIFTQTSKSQKGLVENISEMSFEELRELYFKEGIKPFRHLNLLAPAYITESGDIFGNSDVIGLNETTTKKIVIVQSVPMFEFLEKHEAKHEILDSEIEQTFLCVKKHNQGKILISLIVSFVLWTIAIYLVIVYNSKKSEE